MSAPSASCWPGELSVCGTPALLGSFGAKRGSVVGTSSRMSGQPYQPPGTTTYRSSSSDSIGRLPRTSDPLLATTSEPLSGESSGAKPTPNGLRKPQATISSPVPSRLARSTADVHGTWPLTTWPGVAAVPNCRNGPGFTVTFGSAPSTSLLVQFWPLSWTSLHGMSWNSGCALSQPVRLWLSSPTTPAFVALPSPQYSMPSLPMAM